MSIRFQEILDVDILKEFGSNARKFYLVESDVFFLAVNCTY
jgi:hypothetical protein